MSGDGSKGGLCSLYIFMHDNSEDMYKLVRLYSEEGSFHSHIQDCYISFYSCSFKDSSPSLATFPSEEQGEMFITIVKELVESEGWRMIFSFTNNNSETSYRDIPAILDVSINCSLPSIPVLCHDLTLARNSRITKLSHKQDSESAKDFMNSTPEGYKFRNLPHESRDEKLNPIFSDNLQMWVEGMTPNASTNVDPEFALVLLRSQGVCHFSDHNPEDMSDTLYRMPQNDAIPKDNLRDMYPLEQCVPRVTYSREECDHDSPASRPLKASTHKIICPYRMENSVCDSSLRENEFSLTVGSDEKSSSTTFSSKSTSTMNGGFVDSGEQFSNTYSSSIKFDFEGDDGNPNSISIASGSKNVSAEHPTDGVDSKVVSRSATQRLSAMSLNDLSKYFGMPVIQAAKKLGVGNTVLKRRCRELNIPRWPHRKMKSMEYLINNLNSVHNDEEENNCVSKTLSELEQQRLHMLRNPQANLNERTRRLRQSCFKMQYKYRKLISRG